MTCWAEALGGCGGGVSREHIISASQFDSGSITIFGLPWCREAPKTIGLGSLTAKNLCRDHNRELSPVDAEAARFKKALDIIHTPGTMVIRISLGARLVERWLLKTTITLTLQEPGSGLEVTPELVRRAFGTEPTPAGQGFFMVAEEGEQIPNEDPGIRFETLCRKADDAVVLGIFVFHRWRALYAFDGAPAVRGALRPRRVNANPSWLRFRWRPELEADDRVMR